MVDRWLVAWGLTAIAFGGASLIVPLYVVELGGDAVTLGLLFASASFVGIPGALGFGRLADKTGKRRIFVLTAIVTTTVMMVIIPAVTSIPIVIVANAVLWLGFAAAVPVVTLIVVTGVDESAWTDRIATLNKMQGLGWAGGLLFGFLVTALGSRLTDVQTAQRVFFILCALSAGIGIVIAHRNLPPDSKAAPEPSPRTLRRRVRIAGQYNVRAAAFPFTPSRFDARQLHPGRLYHRLTPRLTLYFGAVILFFTGFGIFFAPLPAYLTDTGFSSSEIFALYLVLNVAAAAFFGYVALLSARYEAARVQAGGLFARGMALPTVTVVITILGGSVIGFGLLGLVFIIIGITWAVIAVTAATLVTQLSPLSIRGEALGMYSALVAFGGGVGGLVGGWLGALDYQFAFLTAGLLVILGGVVVLITVRKSPESPIPIFEETAE